MIPAIPIDERVPESIVKDVRAVEAELARNNDRRVIRLVRVPVLEFERAISGTMRARPGLAFMPFRPTLCGYPVDMTASSVPEIVAVHPGNGENVAHQPGGVDRAAA